MPRILKGMETPQPETPGNIANPWTNLWTPAWMAGWWEERAELRHSQPVLLLLPLRFLQFPQARSWDGPLHALLT